MKTKTPVSDMAILALSVSGILAVVTALVDNFIPGGHSFINSLVPHIHDAAGISFEN